MPNFTKTNKDGRKMEVQRLFLKKRDIFINIGIYTYMHIHIYVHIYITI